MYRTKDPTPKPKMAVIEQPKKTYGKEVVPLLLKMTFIPGLKSIVLDEISKYPEFKTIEVGEDKIYLDFVPNLKNATLLKSVLNVYIVKRSEKYNPYFISNHKSILGDLIDIILEKDSVEKKKPIFKTFKLRCAGSGSKEVIEIQDYIKNTYKLNFAEEVDMEIHINKPDLLWEVGLRITKRPLSLRDYRVANIKGGLNPTIAYAMNTFCNLNSSNSYLNVFSGSGTLLIEAGLESMTHNSNLKLVGFDIDGKSNALAIQNIKKANLIKQIHLKTADVYNKPHLGKFDVIVSDLPFGMQISNKENLDNLYKTFIAYCEETLNKEGVLVVYTTEYKLLQNILTSSIFNIITKLDLVISTSVVNTYLYPRIFVCKFK